MGQRPPEDVVSGARPVTDPAAGTAPNGLAAHVAAVEVARARMAGSLEQLQSEARAQVGVTVERVLWKVAAVGSAVAAAVATRKALDAGWRAVRKNDPPINPAAPGISWPEALGWAIASGVGAGVARMVAGRGAAAGWQRATGHLPPGLTH